MSTKKQIQKQWEAVNNALADLASLPVLLEGKDIAEVEGELIGELDEIEYKVSEKPFGGGRCL